ncbi:hypothetical protein, partial [Klebsiella pneumoniae]
MSTHNVYYVKCNVVLNNVIFDSCLFPHQHGDAGNLKIDKYRPGAPFSMSGDSNQYALFAIFGEFYRFLM